MRNATEHVLSLLLTMPFESLNTVEGSTWAWEDCIGGLDGASKPIDEQVGEDGTG